jgi:phosphohistidine phosphatase SixA
MPQTDNFQSNQKAIQTGFFRHFHVKTPAKWRALLLSLIYCNTSICVLVNESVAQTVFADAASTAANAPPAAPSPAPPAPLPTYLPSALPDPKHALSGKKLLQALQQGGYVIYFRHMAFRNDVRPPELNHPDACNAVNILTTEGKDAAIAVGKFFVAQKIPVDQVVSSPICRVLESTLAMFGRAEQDKRMAGEPDTEHGGFPTLARLFSTTVKPSTNRVIVAHVSGMMNLAGQPALAFGEAVVLKPTSNKPVIVARILQNEWDALAVP